MEDGDTIFAPATAPGRAGVAVLRLSGPRALDAARGLAGRLPPPRRLSRAVLRHPATGEALDDALIVMFPGPGSFTGEDVAELHVHGGRAVTVALAAVLGAMPGLRPAEPGEFSRRAFLNDKLDLSAAEGILDLVDAETDAQRRQALRQLDGGLAARIEVWRDRLIAAMARLEAWIDFPDEDLPCGVIGQIDGDLTELSTTLTDELSRSRRAERLREGLRMTIVGPPNAGKSSLLNWLSQRDVAIVSTTAGTTRDVLEVHLDLGGYPVTVVDTAGLRETADSLEAEGVRRALRQAEVADLRVLMVDAAEGPAGRAAMADRIDENTLAVVNKIDLDPSPPPDPWIGISLKTSSGLGALVRRLERMVEARLDVGTTPALTRDRHRAAVADALDAIDRARQGLADVAPLELPAEDLRLAARALGRIAGRVDVEDLLDRIFAEFCLGK